MLSGWVHILFTCLDAPDILYRNKGDGTFEDVSTAAGFTTNLQTNGPAWGITTTMATWTWPSPTGGKRSLSTSALSNLDFRVEPNALASGCLLINPRLAPSAQLTTLIFNNDEALGRVDI